MLDHCSDCRLLPVLGPAVDPAPGEAAKEIDSSVPWIGFPVAYAVSGVLLTVGGYFAMVLAY